MAIVGVGSQAIATRLLPSKTGARPSSSKRAAWPRPRAGGTRDSSLPAWRRISSPPHGAYGEDNALRSEADQAQHRRWCETLVAEHGINCRLSWNGSDRRLRRRRRVARGSQKALVLRPGRRRDDRYGRACATYAEDGELHPVRWDRGLAAAAVRMARGSRGHAVRAIVGGRRSARRAGRPRRRDRALHELEAYTAHLVPNSRVRPVSGTDARDRSPSRRLRPAGVREPRLPVLAPASGRARPRRWMARHRRSRRGRRGGTHNAGDPGASRRLPTRARNHRRESPTGGRARWASRTTRFRTSDASALDLFVCGGFTGHGMAFGPAAPTSSRRLCVAHTARRRSLRPYSIDLVVVLILVIHTDRVMFVDAPAVTSDERPSDSAQARGPVHASVSHDLGHRRVLGTYSEIPIASSRSTTVMTTGLLLGALP